MADEIRSIADAFNAAKSDDPTIPADSDITPPAVEQAPTVDSDQSEASNPELQAIFDSVDTPVDPDSSIDTQSPGFWNTPIELGEGMSVPLSELRNGYMMQADYTRKTQAVAAEAKRLEQAEQFFQSFQADPQEFARAIAVKQGWLAEDARNPVTEVPGVAAQSIEEQMGQVDQLVEERIQSDPRMAMARQLEAKATIEGKFTEIEQRLGVQIPNTARGEIVLEARRRNVYDLDLITDHWMNTQRDKHRSGAQLKQGASARPQSAGNMATGDVPQEISSFADAVLAAKAELNAGA
jgi:hypothetical protein